MLLSGGCDGRHIIELLAQPAKERVISVDVLEQNLMLYARQLLFLLIIKEDPEVMSAVEKAKFILEVTGNIMIRPKSAKRLRAKISALIDIFSNEAARDEDEANGLEIGSWLKIDLSKLKYKELDGLEAIYKLWRNDEGFMIDMQEAWRKRIQQLLQQQSENAASF